MRVIQWLIADGQIEYFDVRPGSMIMDPCVIQFFVEVVHVLHKGDLLVELGCAHGAI